MRLSCELFSSFTWSLSNCSSEYRFSCPEKVHSADTAPVTVGGIQGRTPSTMSGHSPFTPQGTSSAQAQAFWLQWIRDAFPDLDSQAYFLPPVYINRVPMTREAIASQDVLVLQSTQGQAGQSKQPTKPGQTGQSSVTTCGHPVGSNQPPAAQPSIPQPTTVVDCYVRDDAAMQRILFCLQELFQQKKEVLVGITQLQFGQYLGKPSYAAAAAQLPLPAKLPPALPRNWKQGDFDILLIHKQYGFIVCEVKAFGDIVKELNMSQQDIDKNIIKKMKEAVPQLDKAEAMLSHLVSDIAPGLRITKTIAVPNLTAHQVEQALSGDTQLTQELCRCLGTADPADITSLCICSDQLSNPKTPWEVSNDVLMELGNWWQRRVAVAGVSSQMTSVYTTLVARFCGPATTVTVPWIFPPRLSVKTLSQAVSHIGECYTAYIALFPEQVHLLNMALPRLFIAGPPGTGKTVVLLLNAMEWLRRGEDVYVVCTSLRGYAACIMLCHLLQQHVNEQQKAGVTTGQPQLFLITSEDDRSVGDLVQKAREGSLYVIVDEAYERGKFFQTFCEDLLKRVPYLHLWAASCYHGHAPSSWQVEYLNRPLRSPPVIAREVQQDENIVRRHRVQAYTERGVPDHTDGVPVRRLYHRGQDHSGDKVEDCVTCGREVADFLHSLRVGRPDNVTTSTTASSTSGNTTPPSLQWRDVLVLYSVVKDDSGLMTGMKEKGVPVKMMTFHDTEDMATARSDVVWVADGHTVHGLERKVIVCLQSSQSDYDRLHWLSRCTSQLVIVLPERKSNTYT